MSLTRDNISDRLAAAGYIADRDIATALWLMEFLKRPLLLEGEAGVGKTEVAKALATVHDAELIRLQCYEGLDQNAALYEWNYQRELLSDFQVSIPELGTIKATAIPRVVLTSNGTRELSDALRRRCLYHYVDFPDVDREAKIILTRVPGIDAALAVQIARMVAAVRKEDLRKVPGVAETLDWA